MMDRDFTASPTSPGACRPPDPADRPRHRAAPGGRLVAALVLLAGWGLAPRAAVADFGYTWQEDDGQAVTGSLVVRDSALAAGVITTADVVSFAFSGPGFSATPGSAFTSGGAMTIDPTTGAATGGDSSISANAPAAPGDSMPGVLDVQLDKNYATPSGELSEQVSFPTGQSSVVTNGHGHWVINLPPPPPIVYTWHEDDGQAVTGSLVVRNSALAAGVVTTADIVSFAFSGPGFSATPGSASSSGDARRTIDPTGARPRGGLVHLRERPRGASGDSMPRVLDVQLDKNYATPSGELSEQVSFPTGQSSVVTNGHGHWEVGTRGARAVLGRPDGGRGGRRPRPTDGPANRPNTRSKVARAGRRGSDGHNSGPYKNAPRGGSRGVPVRLWPGGQITSSRPAASPPFIRSGAGPGPCGGR